MRNCGEREGGMEGGRGGRERGRGGRERGREGGNWKSKGEMEGGGREAEMKENRHQSGD